MDIQKESQDFICVAKIVNTHGIAGGVKIKSFTSPAENIKDFKYFFIDNDNKKLLIKNLRLHKQDIFIAYFLGDSTCNNAIDLKNKELLVNKTKIPSLSADEYLFEDLNNLHVASTKYPQKIIGKVIGVFNFGAGDMLEIKLNALQNSFMVLFNKIWINDVNISKNLVIMEYDYLAEILSEKNLQSIINV